MAGGQPGLEGIPTRLNVVLLTPGSIWIAINENRASAGFDDGVASCRGALTLTDCKPSLGQEDRWRWEPQSFEVVR